MRHGLTGGGLCNGQTSHTPAPRSSAMKAVQVTEYHEPPVLVDVPDPEITGPLDVIVKVGGAGVCRTDLHTLEGPCRP